MKICSAAAEVWFESEEIGFGAIGGPWLVIETALNLIRLLVILVRPHVVGKGAGQAVVGDAFEAVAEFWIAHDGERDFKREHRFDYRAEFSPLRGVASGEVLVGGEDAVGQAVVAVELCELMQEGLTVFVFTADKGPYGRGFEGHGVVDAVRGERGVAEAVVLVEFDELRRNALGVLEVGEFCLPAVSLLVEEPGEVEEFGVAVAVVEPEHAHDFVVPAEFAPVAQGARG